MAGTGSGARGNEICRECNSGQLADGTASVRRKRAYDTVPQFIHGISYPERNE